MKYDLEERTAKFAEKIIELCKKVSKNAITLPKYSLRLQKIAIRN